MGFRGYVRFVDSEGRSFVRLGEDWPIPHRGYAGTVKKIAAGLNHAVMITEDGAAYAWGANTCGQTGTGNFDATMRPVRILTDVVVDDVAVGSQHRGLALARDGRLFAFGCNGRGALGRNPSTLDVTATPVEVSTPETFVSVAAAGALSVGLTPGGRAHVGGKPRGTARCV